MFSKRIEQRRFRTQPRIIFSFFGEPRAERGSVHISQQGQNPPPETPATGQTEHRGSFRNDPGIGGEDEKSELQTRPRGTRMFCLWPHASIFTKGSDTHVYFLNHTAVRSRIIEFLKNSEREFFAAVRNTFYGPFRVLISKLPPFHGGSLVSVF